MKLIMMILTLTTLLFSSSDWLNDYDEALKVAQKEDKRVYMLVVSNDCRWCDKFERTTLKDKQIMKRLEEKYILVHLSRETDYVPSKFKTTPVPRHFFLTAEGENIFPVVGYRDVDSFHGFLNTAEERYIKREK